MIKNNDRLYNNVLAILDIILTVLAFYLAYTLRIFVVAKHAFYSDQYILLGAMIVPIWFTLLKIISVQSSQKVKAYSEVFIEYFLIIGIGIGILFILIFIFKLNYISRIAIFIFGIIDLFFLFTSRIVFLQITKKELIKGKNVLQVILIADDSSVPFIEKIINEKYLGFSIFGFHTNSNIIIEKYGSNFAIIKSEEELDKIMENNIVDEIIYCKEEINSSQLKHLIYSCSEIGATLKLHSELFNIIASKSHLNYIEELPIMSFDVTSVDHFALTVKLIIEYLISLISVIIFIPFYILIAFSIKMESKGPVLFKQERVGIRGRIFTMYKFRTMLNNSEEQRQELEDQNEADGPVFKIKDDPRITKVGSFLRKTSLDEFPQFINVLRGEMAIVGPRPPLSSEVALYERYQLRKLSVKPGITCIWQVSGRNNIGFEKWMKLDLQYIDNWSLKLDFIILLKTVNAIFKRTGY